MAQSKKTKNKNCTFSFDTCEWEITCQDLQYDVRKSMHEHTNMKNSGISLLHYHSMM